MLGHKQFFKDACYLSQYSSVISMKIKLRSATPIVPAQLVPVLLNVKSCRPFTRLGYKEGTCLPFAWLEENEGRVWTWLGYKIGRVYSLHD